MIFRGWFDGGVNHTVHTGDETGFGAGGSVVEAGRFPTDVTDENFVHRASKNELHYELRQRQTIDDFSIANSNVNASNQNHRHLGQRLILNKLEDG